MVLLVGALVELEFSLLGATSLLLLFQHVVDVSLLLLDRGELLLLLGNLSKCFGLGSLHADLEDGDFLLVLGKVGAVEGLERGEPDLHLGAEVLVLGRVAEHGVHRVANQVEVLDFGCADADLSETGVAVAERVVRQRHHHEGGQQRQRLQRGERVVV